MCVLSNQEQTADILMAFLAAGVFERIFSTKKRKKAEFLSLLLIPIVSDDRQLDPSLQQRAKQHSRYYFLLLEGRTSKTSTSFCSVCFYNSLEDRSAELIGHLHLLDFNEAN